MAFFRLMRIFFKCNMHIWAYTARTAGDIPAESWPLYYLLLWVLTIPRLARAR